MPARHSQLRAVRSALPLTALLLACRLATAAPPPFDADSISQRVPTLMREFRTPGVSIAIISSNKVSWTGTWGVQRAGQATPVDERTLFEACSMSKPLFAYAALKLVEEGLLNLDRPPVDYLERPYLEDQPAHRSITARMVLTHTSGFPNWRKGGWRKGGPLPVKFTPGSQYGYSGEAFLYLQRVVEHLLEQDLDVFMKDRLLQRIEMRSSGYEFEENLRDRYAAGHDLKGRFKPERRFFKQGNAAYSLYTTPTEYARFLVEIMRDDRSETHSLSREMVTAMLTSGFKATGRHTGWRSLGWQIHETPRGQRVSHGGSNGTGFRCHCRFYPDRKEGIVIMTNSYGGEKLWKQLLKELDP